MTLLEAQTALLDGLVGVVQTCWNPATIYTDQPILPPKGEEGLPEAYVNLVGVGLDRPEQQRMTPTCLESAPMESVRLDVELALREWRGGELLRLQQARQAQAIRSAVLMNGASRRLFAGEPAYWIEESYQGDELEGEALADDCLLRVRFYFVVTVNLA